MEKKNLLMSGSLQNPGVAQRKIKEMKSTLAKNNPSIQVFSDDYGSTEEAL